LVLVAREDAGLEAAQATVSSRYGVDVRLEALDLTEPGSAEALAERCDDVAILVNNAGAVPPGALEDLDEESWRRGWELKVFAYINLTRAMFAGMTRRGGGVIVNVIGVSGERPGGRYISGSTANAALMAFTQALGGESLEHGVRVVGVNPGDTATERNSAHLRFRAEKTLGSADRWAELLVGRRADPDEIAAVVTFLASGLASHVTGTVVTVDGGFSGRGYGTPVAR
jgi:NAD(P)-dependent dehydrogenase (short-subunit alcohol dehydrogenase family)